MAVTIDGTNGINDIVLGSSTPAAATVTTFTSNGIDDNADALAITIDSSENVGIGTAAPTHKLHVTGNGVSTIARVEAQGASGRPLIDFLYNRDEGVTLPVSNTVLGVIDASSYTASATITLAARMRMLAEGNWSGTSAPSAIVFQTTLTGSIGTVERLRINNAGNVGIGTAAPAAPLHVSGANNNTQGQLTVTSTGTDARIEFYNSAAAGSGGRAGIIASGTSGYEGLRFMINGVDKVIIDESGKVGIGTVAPSSTFHVTGAGVPATITSSNNAFVLKLQQSSSSTAYIGTNGNALVLAPSTGTIGATLTSTGLGIGTSAPNSKLTSQTATTSTSAFTFAAQLNNSYASNNSITALGFHNRADVNATGVGAAIAMSGGGVASGSGNLIFCIKSTAGIGNVVAPSDEKMRINSSGQLLIGKTTPNAAGSLLELTSAEGVANVIYMLRTAQVEMTMGFKGSTDSNFYVGTGSSTVGNSGQGVYLANTGTSWVSNSDFRKKKNLSPIENALDKIANCRAMTGHFKHEADDVKKRPFLIAQDWVTALPEAVDEDTVDDDGVENLGLSYEGTIPLLVAAIKELREQNIALINRITALEG
mgnify:CR=1 FL=1